MAVNATWARPAVPEASAQRSPPFERLGRFKRLRCRPRLHCMYQGFRHALHRSDCQSPALPVVPRIEQCAEVPGLFSKGMQVVDYFVRSPPRDDPVENAFSSRRRVRLTLIRIKVTGTPVFDNLCLQAIYHHTVWRDRDCPRQRYSWRPPIFRMGWTARALATHCVLLPISRLRAFPSGRIYLRTASGLAHGLGAFRSGLRTLDQALISGARGHLRSCPEPSQLQHRKLGLRWRSC